MSQLNSSADTIKTLSKLGIGTDAIGCKLYLFHQLNARIISASGNKYYVEGDITSFLSAYNYYWVNSREMSDSHISQISSYAYDSVNLWTEVEMLSTALDGSLYTTGPLDVGSYLCGRYDITELIKEVSNINLELMEDGSLGNSVVSKMNFCINDEDRLFYDKVNKKGYFYPKQVVTEIGSVANVSEHAITSDLYATYINVADLTKYYDGADFVNGKVEFLSGEAIGKEGFILSANGLNLRIFEHVSKDVKDTRRLPVLVKRKDNVRVFKLDTFWFRFDVWHREHIDEKVGVISGKIDLDSITVNDKERTVNIDAISSVRDTMMKSIADMDFDGGHNMYRLREVKALFLDKCSNKSVKIVNCEEVNPNPLQSIKVVQVGFDVSEGWHILDYCPEGNLFRFDLGVWHQAVDEGSFEKSTKSIFVTSKSNTTTYDYYAKLPDHSLESNTFEENTKIERQYHGGWCSFTVDVEDDYYVGSVNNQRLRDGTSPWKKFSGLPLSAHRLLFHVNDEHKVDKQKIVSYMYDNGERVIPNMFFDYIQYQKSDSSYMDVTYDLGFSAMSDRKSAIELPWSNLIKTKMYFCSFNKFNGIYMRFKNTNGSYNAMAKKISSNLRILFSNGYNDLMANANSKYVRGYAIAASSNPADFMLGITDYLDSSENSYYTDMHNKNMWIMSLSGLNFGQVRKIRQATVQSLRSNVRMEMETSFDHNIELNDIFVVINKDADIRFVDLYNSMDDDDIPDVLALKSDDLSSGTFYDVRKINVNNSLITKSMIPGDYIYIGHRRKYESFVISVDLDSGYGDDYADIAWYLRSNFFNVEYWNGSSWIVASNVSIIPSSVVNLKDTSDTVYTDDDKIKYRVMFDAYDWMPGGYDNSGYSAGDAPSPIDENTMYCVRVKLSLNVPIYLKWISLASTNELNLAVFWDNIENWSPSLMNIQDGKYVVDTLINESLNLTLYAAILEKPTTAYADLIEARPITKMKGYLGDSLYSVFDIQNIDDRFTIDGLLYNPNKMNNLSTIPVNFNFLSLANKIFDDTKMFKKSFVCQDHLNDFSRSFANILGSRYDGLYPIDIGWDGAYVSRRGTEFSNITGSYRHICVIRDNGVYRAFCVASTLDAIDLWESTNLVNWTNQGNIVTNLGTNIIMAIDVVKNKNSATYEYYVTDKDYMEEEDWSVKVVTSSSLVIDLGDVPEIVGEAGHNIGRCSVLNIHTKRIMWVERYSSADTGEDEIPNDSCDLYYYESTGAITDPWAHDDGNGGDYGTIADAKNPAFVRANNVANDGTESQDRLLHHYDLLFTKEVSGVDTLYRTYAPYDNKVITYDWHPAIATVSGEFMSGFSTIKDAIVYEFRNSPSSRYAYTVVPGREDLIMMFGILSNAVTVKFVNKELNDWLDNCMFDITNDSNDIDWFATEQLNVELDRDSSDNLCVYYGLQKKFSKIAALTNNVGFHDKLKIEYWNGNEWCAIDTMYQLKRKITDSIICPLFGTYWDDIDNWMPGELNEIADSAFRLSGSNKSLYWIKVSLPSSRYDVGESLNIRGFKCCYTSLFMTQGRNLYLLEDWKYVRQIHTFTDDMQKKIVIDSIVYDKVDKLVLVNIAEDGTYTYDVIKVIVFDAFGRYKGSQEAWDDGVTHSLQFGRPNCIYRRGLENYVTLDGDDLKVAMIGKGLKTYIESVYGGGSFNGSVEVGYNVPIPKKQVIRKYSLRNSDWDLNLGFWNSTNYLNNIWLARMLSAVDAHASNFGDYVFFSLTNHGLLQEELINAPSAKVDAGYYSAMEKSYLGFAYHILITDEITELPVAPADQENYLVVDGAGTDWENGDLWDKVNRIATYNATTATWSYGHPVYGAIIYIEDTGVYKWSDGVAWRTFDGANVWPGRIDAMNSSGIGLEFSLGQEGVKIPYFRPYSAKPDRFLNNNIMQHYDDKVVTSLRSIPLALNTTKVFGNPNTDFPYNLRATCAAELKDLGSMKDYPGDIESRDIIESAAPAMVFGSYKFEDSDSSSAVYRESGFNVVYPFGISSLNLHRVYGKVKDWKRVIHYDGATYHDMTKSMNYKDNDIDIEFDNTQYMYFCSDTKFFSMVLSWIMTVPFITFDIEYYNSVGGWTNIGHTFIDDDRINNLMSSMRNDLWFKKTLGFTCCWDPFINNWLKKDYRGTNGYWMRFKINADPGHFNLHWCIMNGTVLWDSMRWWEDYKIFSDKKPVDPTDEEKRYFDSFAPISIDYDVIRKRVQGCFWDFVQNSYYLFSMQFDKNRIRNASGEYWSFENEGIHIYDGPEQAHLYSISSIKSVSAISSKALMVDPARPENEALIADVKNYHNGEKLFQFDLSTSSGS